MKYFKYEEFERSEMAKKLGINNTADEVIRHNLMALVDNVLDPLREIFGHPITISSGYRCPKLNKAVGGSRTSQHVRGQASDIYPSGKTSPKQVKELGVIIARYLPFDQLIFENCDGKLNSQWIHVSYSESYNRGQILSKAPYSNKYHEITWEDIAKTL